MLDREDKQVIVETNWEKMAIVVYGNAQKPKVSLGGQNWKEN